MASPVADVVDRAHDRAVGIACDRPPSGELHGGVERRHTCGERRRGGRTSGAAAEPNARSSGRRAASSRRVPSGKHGRAAPGEAVDAHRQPLVGPFDRRMRAPCDSMRQLGQPGGGRCAAQWSIRRRIAGPRFLRARAVRADPFDQGAGARGGGLEGGVGDLVGDAPVDLVAEAGEHGETGRGDGAGDQLGVEHGELVLRSAATDHDDRVEVARGGPAWRSRRPPSTRRTRPGPARRTPRA